MAGIYTLMYSEGATGLPFTKPAAQRDIHPGPAVIQGGEHAVSHNRIHSFKKRL